ncbi:hypothetical protein EIKCOROL_02547 [Eikenella corrodens ATCC 23834]|uniref:Uncharacterized protein n=1 Tax=Eikenella corrodens ATCC 23834 TaxID=546274 RepID=C0DYT1_EIKCO|nr:hypothetical protein EIKCOROL_02547 [Eikenella corrodens ATCC 23834]
MSCAQTGTIKCHEKCFKSRRLQGNPAGGYLKAWASTKFK